MLYVTSDLHGYPLDGFLRLLDKASFSDADELIVLGDVIDRNGDGGVGMLRWLIQQVNARMLLGNHEAMLLSCSFLFDTITEDSIERLDWEQLSLWLNWAQNGAEPTVDALRALFREDEETARAILDWLRDAPLYEEVEVPGRRYVLTHAGLGGFSPEKRLSDYTLEELLWNRPQLDDRYFPHITTVFGHTPTALYGPAYTGRMLPTDTWIDIDTGAASGYPPMLLRLDDGRPFYLDD